MKPWQHNLLALWGVEKGGLCKWYTIDNALAGRRLVVGDVHGCYHTLLALLNQAGYQQGDTLILVGDLVNRGPNSHLVLDWVLEKLAEGHRIYPLRGNHEEMLLEANLAGTRRLATVARQNDSAGLLNKRGELRKRYRKFMTMLPFYYTTGKWVIVHAGINFFASHPYLDFKSMTTIRDFWVPPVLPRRIVHGHNPKPLRQIQERVAQQHPVICLENACMPGLRGAAFGNLILFDLESQELFVQLNIDRGQTTGLPIWIANDNHPASDTSSFQE